jgi:hypothetical protein
VGLACRSPQPSRAHAHHVCMMHASADDTPHKLMHAHMRARARTAATAPEAGRQRVLAGRWQHAHELVEGREGRARGEGDGQLRQVLEVARKGRVVKGVVPAVVCAVWCAIACRVVSCAGWCVSVY